MKKNIKYCVIMLLLIGCFATQAMAADVGPECEFYFEAPAYGGKSSWQSELKEDDYDYAKVIFRNLTTSGAVYYRVRARANDSAATGLYSVNSLCTQRLTYNDGYGIRGQYYYLRFQTDSSSTSGASGNGVWVP